MWLQRAGEISQLPEVVQVASDIVQVDPDPLEPQLLQDPDAEGQTLLLRIDLGQIGQHCRLKEDSLGDVVLVEKRIDGGGALGGEPDAVPMGGRTPGLRRTGTDPGGRRGRRKMRSPVAVVPGVDHLKAIHHSAVCVKGNPGKGFGMGIKGIHGGKTGGGEVLPFIWPGAEGCDHTAHQKDGAADIGDSSG